MRWFSDPIISNLRDKLSELQWRYNAVKQQKDELEEEKERLGSQIKNLTIQLQERNNAINGQFSFIKDVENNVWPLQAHLGPEHHQHVHSLDRPIIGVLQACLAQFQGLELQMNHDRSQHRRAINDLNKSNEDNLHKSNVANADKIRELETGHQKDVNRLKAEVSRLEIDLLVTPDNFRPIPDKDLESRFDDLKNLVEKVARYEWECDSTALGATSKPSDFIDIAPRKHYMFFIQSVIWETLIYSIFSTPFRVFGASGDRLFETWQGLFGKQSQMQGPTSEWPRPDKSSEKWRSITFETLLHQLTAEKYGESTAEGTKKSHTAHLADVERKLLEIFGRTSSQDGSKAVRDIVGQARKFAFDLGIQRCRLEFFAPQLSQVINRDLVLYKDMNKEHAELERGIVKLVVAPGIRRTGDGRGYSYRETASVCPASVYLKPS